MWNWRHAVGSHDEVVGKHELDVPMATLGIDSLCSVEVQIWMQRRLGADLTTLEIVEGDSLGHLGLLAQAKMVDQYEARL